MAQQQFDKGVDELAKPEAQEKVAQILQTGEAPKGGISKEFTTALVGILPTVVGALFEGSEGAAVGANVGVQGVQNIQAQEVQAQELARKERQQRADEAFRQQQLAQQALLQEQRLESQEGQAEAERVFKAQQTEIDQTFRGKQAALERGLKRNLQQEQQSFTLGLQAQKLEQSLDESKKELNTSLTKEIRDRLERDPITVATKQLLQSFKKIEASAAEPSAAGDLALIFAYMKMLDPGSAVREQEFANAEKAGSVPNRAWGIFQKVKAGTKLTPEQRADFVNRAKKLMAAQLDAQKGVDDAALSEATTRGADTQFSLNPAIVEYRKRLLKSNPGIVKSVDSMSSEQRRTRLQELRAKAGK